MASSSCSPAVVSTPVGHDTGDRCGPQIDERHVVAVERLVVAGVQAGPLARVRVVGRAQQLSDRGVGHDAPYLAPKELRGGVVGLLRDLNVGERIRNRIEVADLVGVLVHTFPLIGVDLEGRTGRRQSRDAERGGSCELPQFVVGRLDWFDVYGFQRPVERRRRIDRCPLEDGQGGGLLGDQRDRLQTGGAGADDADAQTREVDPVVRPLRGVVRQASEARHPGNLGHLGHREATGGDDAELGVQFGAGVGAHQPTAAVLVKLQGIDPRRGPHVAAQVEPVRDVFEVTQDLGLGGELFGPLPLLLQLRGERERIEHALDVAARSGVAVAVPGAAHTGLGLQRHGPQAGSAQLVKGVEPGHAGPHHHHVQVVASRCRLVVARQSIICCLVCCGALG